MRGEFLQLHFELVIKIVLSVAIYLNIIRTRRGSLPFYLPANPVSLVEGLTGLAHLEDRVSRPVKTCVSIF